MVRFNINENGNIGRTIFYGSCLVLIPFSIKMSLGLADIVLDALKRNKDKTDEVIFKSIDTGLKYANNKIDSKSKIIELNSVRQEVK